MCLKFYSISTRGGNRINERMCKVQAAIVGLCDFCDDQDRLSFTDFFLSNGKRGHGGTGLVTHRSKRLPLGHGTKNSTTLHQVGESA